MFEYVAAAGLWWNVLWWEWADLNGRDIALGWASNLIVFGVIAGAGSFFWGVIAAGCTFLLLHAVTTAVGFKLRGGTSPQNEVT